MIRMLFAASCIGAISGASAAEEPAKLIPAVKSYLEARAAEFDEISQERRAALLTIAEHVKAQQTAGKPIRLVFICTHNSRRSQLSQLWAAAAADYYGIRGVTTYSGGTEATAFNPRAVAAAQRCGVVVEKTTHDDNPIYHARVRTDGPALTLFSKVYSDAPNPRSEVCCVMVCNEADEACPAVPGAARRVALPFVDPKVSDGTAQEAATYDERCRQICREMLFVMSSARGRE